MYSHALVESAKAINLHDLSSDWINLKEKEQIPHKFFSFQGMFSLCAVKTYVENILRKPGLQVFQMVLLFSFINTLGLHGEGMGPFLTKFCGREAWLEISLHNHPFQLRTSVD